MSTLVRALALAVCLASTVVTTHALAKQAPGQRAYAPENLQTLSVADRTRVISLEYSEQSRGRHIPDDQLRFYLDQVRQSGWTFSRIKADIATSLSGNPGLPPPTTGNIRCESINNRAQTCQTPWRGPSRLVRQLSGSSCVEGQTWQSQQGQVYVGGGCRAEFAAAPTAPPPDLGRIRCESKDSRPRTCATPWRGMSRIARQLSSVRCVEGQSWRSDRGQVWVSQGCRAEFMAAGAGAGPYSVTCTSTHGLVPTRCAWDHSRGQPRLLQQLSGRCIDGLTWGDNGHDVWVSGGCSARFGVR